MAKAGFKCTFDGGVSQLPLQAFLLQEMMAIDSHADGRG